MNNGINLQKDNQNISKNKNSILSIVLFLLLGLVFISVLILIGLNLYVDKNKDFSVSVEKEKIEVDPGYSTGPIYLLSFVSPEEVKLNVNHWHREGYNFSNVAGMFDYSDWCPFELKDLGEGDADSFERIIVDSGFAGFAPPSEQLDEEYTITLTGLVVEKIDAESGVIKLKPISNPIFYINGCPWQMTYVETPDSIKVGDEVKIFGIIRSDMKYSDCAIKVLDIIEIS